ncbi:MAG: hypothetical protein DRN17_06475 [Thermoplasmata archaeon]|nr:MAG: hypothetical protein DRN17_06475 [Thermoplasmata archaeon]
MSINTYSQYEAVIPNIELRKVAPDEYKALYDFMEEHDIDEWDMQILWQDKNPTCILSTEPTDEDWDILTELIESFRSKIGDETGINIYPFRIDGDAYSELAGEILWGADFELSSKLQTMNAYVESWVEVG